MLSVLPHWFRDQTPPGVCMCIYTCINVEQPGHAHLYLTPGNILGEREREIEKLGLRGTDLQ